ncbi:MAG: hypothetical protein WBB07_03495 [Mycobacterium sp.]
MVAPSVPLLPGPAVRVADHDAAGSPGHDEIVPLSAPLSDELSDEFDGAVEALGVVADVLLLAALGRAVERTLGAGYITVDIADGQFAGSSVALRCAAARDVDATSTLIDVDRLLASSAGQGGEVLPSAEIALAPTGTAPVELSVTRAVQVCVARHDGIVGLEWWYDSRRFDGYTIEELSEQFSLALIELSSEAVAPLQSSDPAAEATLVQVG